MFVKYNTKQLLIIMVILFIQLFLNLVLLLSSQFSKSQCSHGGQREKWEKRDRD